MSNVVYADDAVGPYTIHRRHALPHGQNASGYGRKITTSIMLKFACEKRMRRVYCTCFSNAGSNWIVYKGQKLWLRTHFQDEVLDS